MESKKLLYLLLFVLAVVGAVGGIGYACYNHAYVIAVGVGVLSYLAWPQFRKLIDKIVF